MGTKMSKIADDFTDRINNNTESNLINNNETKKSDNEHRSKNEIYTNRRCLNKDALTYELENFDKNLMLIFNHFKCPDEDDRVGTEKDVKALRECFERLKFEVHSYNDCTKQQLLDNLEKAISGDLSDYGCFAIVILTHGGEDGKLLTRDKPIYENNFIDYIKASATPSLATKPKLLIVQACRGDEISECVTIGEHGPELITSVQNDATSSPSIYRIPNEADLLLIHSTFPGKKAKRDINNGSWFIQSLCESINKSKEEDDTISILTRMQHHVSVNCEHETTKGLQKQMPVVTTTLTRKLYLKSQIKMLTTRKMLTTENDNSQISQKVAKSVIPFKKNTTVQAAKSKASSIDSPTRSELKRNLEEWSKKLDKILVSRSQTAIKKN